MYVIVKHIKNTKKGKILPVILLNSESEIWEFENEMDAEKITKTLNGTPTTKHFYQVKKL